MMIKSLYHQDTKAPRKIKMDWCNNGRMRARATVMAFMYGVPIGTMQQVINNIWIKVANRVFEKLTGGE